MSRTHQPHVVVGSDAPGYVQNLASDLNDGIGRLNSGLQTTFADIQTAADATSASVTALGTTVTALGVTVSGLAADVVTPATSVKVTYNARGQITSAGTATASDISGFDTSVRTSRVDQMGSPGADVPWAGVKITNLGDATADTDALNRQTGDARYVNVTGDHMDASIRFGQNSTDNVASVPTLGGCFHGASSDAFVALSRATLPGLYLNVNAEANLALFYCGGSNQGSISITATATAFNTSSDYRLKEDLEPILAPLDRLKALRPLSFHWKSDDKRLHKTDGFLAHEVKEIVPVAVRGERDDDAMQMLDHSKLVPLLIGAVQELSAKVEQLEQRSSG